MSFLQFIRCRLAGLPENKHSGCVYFTEDTNGVYIDYNDSRTRINPPASWTETNQQSPEYIANKPGVDIYDTENDDTDISLLNTNLPSSKLLYYKLRELQTEIETIRASVGHPYKAALAEDMDDTDKIYVYTGSETGMTAGHWYYYDGSDWVDGGAYNSSAISTDNTLLVSGMAADSKATGDEITELKAKIAELQENVNNLMNAVFADPENSLTVKYLNGLLETYDSDTVSIVKAYAFRDQTNLTSVTVPATTIEQYALAGCTALTTVDLTSTTASTIGENAFNGSTSLDSLIIRSETMATLANTNAFTDTKIASLDGFIYVPGTLVDTYKADSTWGNYSVCIVSLDDYPIGGGHDTI